MLQRESWVSHGETVPEGESRRFDHDCGGGRTLLVSRTVEGTRAWCFRCNDGDSIPPPRASLADVAARLARIRQEDEACTRVLSLPEPSVHDVDEWPVAARLWLYRCGLGRSEIGKLGAYWHVPTARVVLPVRNERGEVVYWQARAVDGRKPKYLGSATDKQKVVAAYGTTGERVVLVEDILSAFKVGLQFHSVSLLGTSMSNAVANHVAQLGGLACVWLDPDAPGQSAARVVRRRLSLMGVSVCTLFSPVDPKLLTHAQIAAVVTAAGTGT